MAGIQTQPRFDVCATVQSINQSTRQFRNYDFLLPKFENTLSTNTLATCDGKFAHIECKACKYNDGTMTNTRQNLDYRIPLENDLLGQTRLWGNCDNLKYRPCNVDRCNCNKSTCNYKALNQPLLCDRSVNPTNMKQYASGFTYN